MDKDTSIHVLLEQLLIVFGQENRSFFIYVAATAWERTNFDRVLEPLTEKTQSHRALDNSSFGYYSTEGGMLRIKPTEPGYTLC